MLKLLRWVTILLFATLRGASAGCIDTCTNCIPGTCIEEAYIIAGSVLVVLTFLIVLIVICAICWKNPSGEVPMNYRPTRILPPAMSAVSPITVNVTVAGSAHYGSTPSVEKAPAAPASTNATLKRDTSNEHEYCAMATPTTRTTSRVNSLYEELQY